MGLRDKPEDDGVWCASAANGHDQAKLLRCRALSFNNPVISKNWKTGGRRIALSKYDNAILRPPFQCSCSFSLRDAFPVRETVPAG